MKTFSDTGETGPVYDVPLIDSLPLTPSWMRQAMPSRQDLEQVRKVNERTAAGYEVLLAHYRRLLDEVEDMRGEA